MAARRAAPHREASIAAASRAAMALAWRAKSSQCPSSSHASYCAATNQLFEKVCPARCRAKPKSRARAGSKKTTASAAMAPFLVAPKESTSTPAFQREFRRRRPGGGDRIGKARPVHMDGEAARLRRPGERRDRVRVVGGTEFGEVAEAERHRLAFMGRAFADSGRGPPQGLRHRAWHRRHRGRRPGVPPENNSVAPASATRTCAPRWQRTTPPGRAKAASARALAAVPVATKNTATCRSKRSDMRWVTARVRSSPP